MTTIELPFAIGQKVWIVICDRIDGKYPNTRAHSAVIGPRKVYGYRIMGGTWQSLYLKRKCGWGLEWWEWPMRDAYATREEAQAECASRNAVADTAEQGSSTC